jgi:hypothetical protein
MANSKSPSAVALVLTVIGGINWGLIGAFDFDVVSGLFGYMSVFTRVIYAVIGISSIYVMVSLKKYLKN